MAIPKIFISSTYYDLMHIRADLEGFVKGLGYEPIMHERNGVTYSQANSLEDSCYEEISNCDILVCIIGSKYGSEAEIKNYSITMNELKTALNQKKKVYIFIQQDVNTENRTYLKNRDRDGFEPAFVDNIKIHEFIAGIKEQLIIFQ